MLASESIRCSKSIKNQINSAGWTLHWQFQSRKVQKSEPILFQRGITICGNRLRLQNLDRGVGGFYIMKD